MYYIISLVNTMAHERFVTLWRPNNAGYCFSKENAGVYTEPVKGYHDSEINMPIKVEDADKLMIDAKLYGDEIKKMIPNCKAVWDTLGVKMTKRNGLVKIKTK